jgi:hypothetical protein
MSETYAHVERRRILRYAACRFAGNHIPSSATNKMVCLSHNEAADNRKIKTKGERGPAAPLEDSARPIGRWSSSILLRAEIREVGSRESE